LVGFVFLRGIKKKNKWVFRLGPIISTLVLTLLLNVDRPYGTKPFLVFLKKHFMYL